MTNNRTPRCAAGVQHSARPLLAGAAAAAAGALAWTAVAYLTGYQFEVLAALIGVAVGAATKPAGTRDPRLQAAGAALAVAGCALGTLTAMIAVLHVGYGVSLGLIFGHFGTVVSAYPSTVGWLGLLFWAVAAAGGAFPGRRHPAASPVTGLPEAARDVSAPRQGQPPDLHRYPAGPGWTQPWPQQPDRAPEDPARQDTP